MTPKERRFIKYWEEQRKGGKLGFFALYISMGTIVTTIAVCFLISVLGLKYAYWPVPIIGLLSMFIITWLTWNTNEKQFKNIIKRIVNEDKQKDLTNPS